MTALALRPSPAPTSPPPAPPRPLPDPPLGPGPGITVRIGRPPHLPRRKRIARVLVQLGRYALGWGAVVWSCFWLADVHLLVPGFVIAAMVCNPWRRRRPA